jgi:hypothetical protein
MPLAQKDIRKLQPPMPLSVRRRASSSPIVTTADSKISREGQSSMTSTSSLHHKRSRRTLGSSDENGYGSTGPSSPIVYWSEFENPEEPEPYTVPVNESTGLLSWMRGRKQNSRDLEAGPSNKDSPSRPGLVTKLRSILESQVKVSEDGLTTLFYEKGIRERDSDDEEYNSEDSSDGLNSPESSHPNHIQDPSQPLIKLSRPQLLNRGYSLCVIGCLALMSIFGLVGVILSGSPVGITILLIGYIVTISLEIVSLVRFMMYLILHKHC